MDVGVQVRARFQMSPRKRATSLDSRLRGNDGLPGRAMGSWKPGMLRG